MMRRRQYVRQRSARIIGGIAVGAVLAFHLFLIIIWRDITRSNRYRRELEERTAAEELLNAREKLMLAITHDLKHHWLYYGIYRSAGTPTNDERQRFISIT